MNGDRPVLTHLHESGEVPRMVDITTDAEDAIVDRPVPCTGRTSPEREAFASASVAAPIIDDMGAVP